MTDTAATVSEPTCGDCYACCIHLGVEELHKMLQVTCKHLTGANGPDKRCGIYASRPEACAVYKCVWRMGLLKGGGLRPTDSGVIVTPYAEGMSLMVFDLKKSGHLQDKKSKIAAILGQILGATGKMQHDGPYEIRVVLLEIDSVVIFRNGLVYRGMLLPNNPGNYEELNFIGDEKHVGRYRVETREDTGT